MKSLCKSSNKAKIQTTETQTVIKSRIQLNGNKFLTVFTESRLQIDRKTI